MAIKLALEERQHWLAGSDHLVLIWMDHKNLAYLQAAKRLNTRQARWALFFRQFSLTITYRPRSRNMKPDVLSHQFALHQEALEKEKTILPSTRKWSNSLARLKYMCGVLFMFLLPTLKSTQQGDRDGRDVHVPGRKCSGARVSHTCRSSAAASCSRLPSLAMSLLNRVAELQLMLDC